VVRRSRSAQAQQRSACIAVGQDSVRSHHGACAPVSPHDPPTREAHACGTLVVTAQDLPEAPRSAELSTLGLLGDRVPS
jgi:hypothetical protein